MKPLRRGTYRSPTTQEAREKVQRRRHGLIASEKLAIAEAQGGCPICRRTDPGRAGWVVDHDHTCCPRERSCASCRRGVICQACNMILGYVKDDPEVLRRAIAYLADPPGIAPSIAGASA